MHDFSCTAHSTPTTPFSSLCTCVLGDTERPLNCGESSQLGKEFRSLQRAASDVKAYWWCGLSFWLEGGAGWGRSTLKETEEVSQCKAVKQPFSKSQLPTRPPGDYKEEHLEVKQRRDEGDGNERTWAVRFQCKWVLIWLCPQGLGGRKQRYKVQGRQCTSCVSFFV